MTLSERQQLTGRHVTLGLRPGALVVSDDVALRAEVDVVEELGAHTLVHCTVALQDGPANLVVRGDGRAFPTEGERIGLSVLDRDVHLFDSVTGSRVNHRWP